MDEAMMGDLIEQLSRGRSVFWLWRQVLASVVIDLFQKLFQGRDPMKRMATSMVVVLGVFLFGFWAGRTPLLETIDPPPRLQEISESNLRNSLPRVVRKNQVYGTTEFLSAELDRARKDALRENTPESKQRVTNLERKLEDARRAMALENSRR